MLSENNWMMMNFDRNISPIGFSSNLLENAPRVMVIADLPVADVALLTLARGVSETSTTSEVTPIKAQGL